MAAFRYEAFDATGRVVSGVLQAETPRHARSQLRTQGLLPSAVDPVNLQGARRPWARDISAAELSLITRQMATLLESGLTMEQTLTALIDEADKPLTGDVLSAVKAEVLAGAALARALASQEKTFPEFYRALVHGGEESGALPLVLQHLADYLDARGALKQKTTLALLYPMLVTLVAAAIVTGLLAYVVPQVVQVFQQSRQALPLLTRMLIGFSDLLRAAWPYLAALGCGGYVAARFALRRDAVRQRVDAMLLRLPGVGPLIRGVNTARFASTLAILVKGGVPLLGALTSTARVVTNRTIERAIERAISRVREGASLARALGETRAFPPLLVHLIASGEASGKLGPMLERAALLETRALERRLSVFLTLLEPLMILLMGAIVLTIVLAILLPIIEINQLVR
ncbi:MAG: gspF [Betaproteobacteria bacterium]|nr:gspF [Betaproteobacteria bacterium]